MQISSLFLENYRNYHQLQCAFCPGINLVTGANAQGKTNLIESIYYLSIGHAYRQARDAQLIRWGSDRFRIEGKVESRQGKTDIGVDVGTSTRPAKTITVGGLRGAKTEELSGVLLSVLFSPESMAIIKGSPQERRSFLDYDVGQISLTYHTNSNTYKRLLAQRNALLKKLGRLSTPITEKKERLLLWDQQLIEYGCRIIEKRISFLEKMTPMVRLTQRKLTEGRETLELQYMLSQRNTRVTYKTIDKTKGILGFLKEACDQCLEDDLRLGSTHWGPHRDDVRFLLDGMDIKQYGSQGQQRTGVLALKMAELEIFRGETGEYPILLLDDVLSELDESRQRQLLQMISEKAIQCIITTTESMDIPFSDKRPFKQFSVHQGSVIEI